MLDRKDHNKKSSQKGNLSQEGQTLLTWVQSIPVTPAKDQRALSVLAAPGIPALCDVCPLAALWRQVQSQLPWDGYVLWCAQAGQDL